jgi:hypothetical protein
MSLIKKRGISKIVNLMILVKFGNELSKKSIEILGFSRAFDFP